jgi:signal transduction histidine kinase
LTSGSHLRLVVEIDPVAAALMSARASDVVQVACEALSNAGRHAQASTVRLSLSHAGGHGMSEVADDGRGLGPSTGWHGLTNMRARAAALALLSGRER